MVETERIEKQAPPRVPHGSPILRAVGLHKTYRMGGDKVHVLRGVDLSVNAGEWLAVLGASGSGKSTLLHLLGGLDRPERGEVMFDGEPVFKGGQSQIDLYRNRTVGFVFQQYHLLPELSALENVMIVAMIGVSVGRFSKERQHIRKRASELLDQMGLGDRLKHRPNKLSGGERQRVAIARALVNEPAVLLADEPTGNLDEETGQQIMGVFGKLHQQGQTVVMVTHDQRIAALADRQLRLDRGNVAQSG